MDLALINRQWLTCHQTKPLKSSYSKIIPINKHKIYYSCKSIRHEHIDSTAPTHSNNHKIYFHRLQSEG